MRTAGGLSNCQRPSAPAVSFCGALRFGGTQSFLICQGAHAKQIGSGILGRAVPPNL